MSKQDRTKYSREYMSAWRKRNPDRARAIGKRSHAKPQTRFSALKSEAKRRSLDVSITLEQYKEATSHPCYYCGGNLPEGGGGLDRINSNIGYVQDNVRPCCADCNIAKSSQTEVEFKEWVLRVSNNWVGKD